MCLNLLDPPPTPPETTSSPSPAPTPASQQHHADPEEVDISEHYYTPQRTERISPSDQAGMGGMSEAQLRQMMLGFDQPAAGPGGADLGEDPMMKLLSQMMSGAGGNPFGGGSGAGGANPFGPGGGNPFGPGSPFAQAAGGGQQQPTAIVTDRYSAIWRLLHTAVALGLGLYIAIWTGFSGTKLQRNVSELSGGMPGWKEASGTKDEDEKRFSSTTRFFWAFATAEAVLLTTRYFFDRVRAPPGGIVGSLVGFLPQPYKGYVDIAMRYGQIFNTVKGDVLVCVFVLGVCSLLRAV